MKQTLLKRDSKNKLRVVNIWLEKNDNIYIIKRTSGLLDGKLIEQPEITIDKGKVKRTIKEQAELMFASNVNKYLDKGYKSLESLNVDSLDDIDDKSILQGVTTDNNGAVKPMLAKSSDAVNQSLFNSVFYVSVKLDGTRCTMWYDEESDMIKTSSRGGKNYDIPSTYIREDPELIRLLKTNKIILDGELYIHGTPLNVISGLCRLEKLKDEHKELKYYVYDIATPGIIFKERMKKLSEYRDIYKSNKIKIIYQYPVSGMDNFIKEHDKAVGNGYEGIVLRDPTKEYGFNKRDNRMIKIKMFQDDEFEIIGLEEGLRDEDLCFVMKTNNNKTFKAKPIGSRDVKAEYRKNINNIIGKMGTVKYFGYTSYGIPNLPVFKSIRDYE